VVRIARQRPAGGRFAVDDQVRAGEDEAALVAHEHAVEPFRARCRADEHEHGSGVDRLLVPGVAVGEHELLQVAVAARLGDLGARADGTLSIASSCLIR
jgi:hypothetical protein